MCHADHKSATAQPTPQERRTLTALASDASRREAADQAGVTGKALTATLESLRDRYAPTLPALIALAVKLEWITVPIWTMKPTPPLPLNTPPTTTIHKPRETLRGVD